MSPFSRVLLFVLNYEVGSRAEYARAGLIG
jgi:hypothetical protein